MAYGQMRVAPGYGPYTPAPVVKTSNWAKRNLSGAKQTLMQEQIFNSPDMSHADDSGSEYFSAARGGHIAG